MKPPVCHLTFVATSYLSYLCLHDWEDAPGRIGGRAGQTASLVFTAIILFLLFILYQKDLNKNDQFQLQKQLALQTVTASEDIAVAVQYVLSASH